MRRLVRRSVIVDRLQAAGKLEAARAVLDTADLYTRERWNAREAIYADDPTAIALLRRSAPTPRRSWRREARLRRPRARP